MDVPVCFVNSEKTGLSALFHKTGNMTYSYVNNYVITMLITLLLNNLYLWIPFPVEYVLIVLTFQISNHLAFLLPSEYCVHRIGIVACCDSTGAHRQSGLVWARVHMRRVEDRSEGGWVGSGEVHSDLEVVNLVIKFWLLGTRPPRSKCENKGRSF